MLCFNTLIKEEKKMEKKREERIEPSRKSPEEIKSKILEVLNDKPLNALEISKAINSNWSTVKTYVEEVVKEGKAKEINFAGQIIYQKITDTYYNIPITLEQEMLFKFIFDTAIKNYNKITRRTIRRTELAKLCAELNSSLNLNLPIVWYIYGPMPLMIIDIQKDYSSNFVPNNANEIGRYIDGWIRNNVKPLIRELKVEYYQKSKNQIYVLKEKIYHSLEKKNYNNFSELVFDFLSAVVSYNKEFEGINSEFYEIVSGASYIHLFENSIFQNKVLLCFDSLWKYLASNMLVDSLLKLNYSKEDVWILVGPIIETKLQLTRESIRELNEFYLENIPEKIVSPNLTEIDSEARKVLDQWMESETWRE
jgi:predicted transcriptional regulator